jgi:hypothetical protein
MQLDLDGCNLAGGLWSGLDATCADIDCGDLGACCVDNHCDLQTSIACESVGGDFHGPWSTCEQEDMDCDGLLNVPEEYESIQMAVNVARSDDVILVAPGTYHYGWAGSLEIPTDRNLTLISSEGPESTIIDGGDLSEWSCIRIDGMPGGDHDNIRIEGFTIRRGRATALGVNRGGGIYCGPNSNVTIENCTIENNTSVTRSVDMAAGGGVYNQGSLTLKNCTFKNNSLEHEFGGVDGEGGGVFTSGATQILNCTFHNNSARWGGALFNSDTSPIIRFCIFKENQAEGGSAVYNAGSSNPTIYKSELSKNTISGDSPDDEVGSLQSMGTSTPSLEGTLFCENEGGLNIIGPWDDLGGNDFPDICPIPCFGDFDGNGARDIDDLLLLLGEFSTDCSDGCQTDLDEDGDVDIDDMLAFLGVWGPCP